MTTELFFVDKQCELGRMVDLTALIEGSQNANMLALTAEDIAGHEAGVFVTAGLGKNSLALGYIGCKSLSVTRKIAGGGIGPSVTESSNTAVVGGLYLDGAIRGQGIAGQLISCITEKVFSDFSDIEGCVAYCNPDSGQRFVGQGYQLLVSASSLFVPEQPDKTALYMNRDHWTWIKKYRDATIREQHGSAKTND